jgi:hypothetical protein|tara:strand:+ start:177 stop:440 length:264 start_codon:yes stop_codon:yes gene_type:complete
MIKELKYFFYMLLIFLFIFLILKYYFSDQNKKNSYRSLKNINEKIIQFSQNLILLNNNTNSVTEYVKKTIDKNKKNYHFWKLINNND